VGVGVGVGVGVIVARGDGEGVGVAVGEALGEATGAGFATATPLFHTNLFPLFIHVYFLPLYVEVAPAFEHFVPGVTAASDS
jgi:hypothetical protein